LFNLCLGQNAFVLKDYLRGNFWKNPEPEHSFDVSYGKFGINQSKSRIFMVLLTYGI
jgi:hypothetical protein